MNTVATFDGLYVVIVVPERFHFSNSWIYGNQAGRVPRRGDLISFPGFDIEDIDPINYIRRTDRSG